MGSVAITGNIRRVMEADLRQVILAQLPRDLQTKLKVHVRSDAYHIGGVVYFQDAQGRTWNTPLETTDIDGVPVACVVPDHFITHLCAAV